MPPTHWLRTIVSIAGVFFLLFTAGELAAQRGGGGAQGGLPMPTVRNSFLSDALEELDEQGFTNVDVARVWMTDMPPVVLEQIPEPSAQTDQGFAPLYPPFTRVWLVVVEGFPRLPDLTGWRADRALALVEALSTDITANVDAPDVDLSQSTVVGQDPPPGLVDPAGTVLLQLGPFPPPSVPDLPDLTGWRADRALALVRELSPTIAASLDDALADPSAMVVVSQSLPPGPVGANASVEFEVEPMPLADTTPTVARPTDESSDVPLGTVAIITLAGFVLGGIGATVAFRQPPSAARPRASSSSSGKGPETSEHHDV